MGKGVIRFYDPDGENGYLSNWYRADFRYAGRSYSSVEQYMMMQKALTFGDSEIAEQIQASDDLREIKRLGHMVARYNDSLWKAIRVQILRRGIRAKFQQNPRLLCDLLATGNALLAECAPRDLVWGIGIDIEDSRSGDPKEWKGRNLLGRTLMRVREDLRAWAAVAGSSVTAYEDAVDLRAPRPVKPSRRSDGSEAERIRRELMQSFGEEAEGGFGEDAAKNGPDIPAGVDGADPGVKDSANADTKSESSVWNMHIYEACMLPYLSEIVSTWLEEVLFNLRRSRSYEDLGVSNYTFEELEWMLRSGQSAGLPKAGFFEMKQDIFDMMRYQGGLRNPAALLAQVDIQETLEEPELPDSEIADLAEHQPDEHITVAFRPHGDGTMIATIDPGTTSAPETYVTYLPATAGGEPAAYAQEAGEEAKTSIGSTPVDSRPAAELWNDIRKLAGEEDEPEPVEDNIIDELNRPETYAETTPAPAEEAAAAEPAETEPAASEPIAEAPAENAATETPAEEKAAPSEEKPVEKPAAKAEAAAEKPAAKPAAKAEAVAEKPKAKDVLPEEKKAPAEEKKAVAEAVKVAAETAAETPKKAEEAPKQKPGRSAAEASILKRTQHAAKPADDLDEDEDEIAEKPAETKKAEPKKEAPKPVEKPAEKPKVAAETAAAETAAAKPAEKPAEAPKVTAETVAAETGAEEKKPAPKKEAPKVTAETVAAETAPAEAVAAKPAEKPAEKLAEKPAEEPKKTYRDEVRSEIVIKHGNIAAMSCDAIVNATNNTLLGGPGIDNTILHAGGPELLRECAALRGCDVGRAKISRGYRLKAAFVIHTVGPKYSGDETDPVYLTMCYENCLNLAMKYDLHSVAFPPISTGYFGYPLREATMVASRTVQGWMRRHPEYGIKVIFVSADERTFAMYREILSGKK